MKCERPIIDSHCHLGWQSLRPDLDAVLGRALEAEVIGIVDVGIHVASSREALERAGSREGVLFPTAGLHPCDCRDFERDFPEIEALAASPLVVAIGETGLDLYWKEIPLELQLESLEAHIGLGRRLGKPLVLHCRDAFTVLLDFLEKHAPLEGVLHCFSGSREEALRCLDLGLHLGFGGPLTYPRNEALRKAAAEAPSNRILIETDAPFLPPQPRRGRRNEPAFVVHVLETLASVRREDPRGLAGSLRENTCHFFGIPSEGGRGRELVS